MLLFPLCFLAYAYAAFGSKWQLYLRYRFSHSKPSVSLLYMPKEARDNLRAELYDPGSKSSPSSSDSESGDKNDKKQASSAASEAPSASSEAPGTSDAPGER